MSEKFWTQEEAISVCKLVEEICPPFGCHVALTGGCLYKDGERKDLDLLFYRIRQAETIEYLDLFEAMERIGFTVKSRHGWVVKATFKGKSVDIFFPEIDQIKKPEAPKPTLTQVYTTPIQVGNSLLSIWNNPETGGNYG